MEQPASPGALSLANVRPGPLPLLGFLKVTHRSQPRSHWQAICRKVRSALEPLNKRQRHLLRAAFRTILR
jgi:hypothetical protein